MEPARCHHGYDVLTAASSWCCPLFHYCEREICRWNQLPALEEPMGDWFDVGHCGSVGFGKFKPSFQLIDGVPRYGTVNLAINHRSPSRSVGQSHIPMLHRRRSGHGPDSCELLDMGWHSRTTCRAVWWHKLGRDPIYAMCFATIPACTQSLAMHITPTARTGFTGGHVHRSAFLTDGLE